jgi:HD-like signal output (HDOD) protein
MSIRLPFLMVSETLAHTWGYPEPAVRILIFRHLERYYDL